MSRAFLFFVRSGSVVTMILFLYVIVAGATSMSAELYYGGLSYAIVYSMPVLASQAVFIFMLFTKRRGCAKEVDIWLVAASLSISVGPLVVAACSKLLGL